MLIETGVKGLSITIGTDGIWINTSASTGKHCSFNLRNVANSKGMIMKQAILDWCTEVSEAHNKPLDLTTRSRGKSA